MPIFHIFPTLKIHTDLNNAPFLVEVALKFLEFHLDSEKKLKKIQKILTPPPPPPHLKIKNLREHLHRSSVFM